MPTHFPLLLKAGPPEFPEFMATSISHFINKDANRVVNIDGCLVNEKQKK